MSTSKSKSKSTSTKPSRGAPAVSKSKSAPAAKAEGKPSTAAKSASTSSAKAAPKAPPAKAEKPAERAAPSKAHAEKPAPKAPPAKVEPVKVEPAVAPPVKTAEAAKSAPAKTEALPPCAKCGKPGAICVCDRTEHFKPKHAVVILQHPQELDVELGTARIAELSLAGCVVRPGLSWASLSHALGREIDPKRWAVLWSGSLDRELTLPELTQQVLLLDRHANPLEKPAKLELEGIVALDGTWSQAKTLWWRNPWLLKHPRVLLHPKEPSVYGSLRKEPKRESLSTLEAVTAALVGLGSDPAIEQASRRTLRTLCQRARDVRAAQAPVRTAPKKLRAGSRGRTKGKPAGKPRDRSDVL